MSIQIHLAPRVLTADGNTHPKPIEIESSIMAGLTDSVDLVKALLHRRLSEVVAATPHTTLGTCVDDCAQTSEAADHNTLA